MVTAAAVAERRSLTLKPALFDAPGVHPYNSPAKLIFLLKGKSMKDCVSLKI
jgi:hypothetical protein